jgi:WD40 repeat protein
MKKSIWAIALSAALMLLASACNRGSTPEPRLEPTRTVAPRTPEPTATVRTETSAAPTRTPRPKTLTGLTVDNASKLAPLYTRQETPPQHIYSVADDAVVVFNTRDFELYDPKTLDLIKKTDVALPENRRGFWYAASPNGKLGAIMHEDGKIDLYDLQSSGLITSLAVPPPSFEVVSDIALNDDGSEIVVVSKGEMQRYDLASGQPVGEKQTLPPLTEFIRFSENAARLAAIQPSGQIVVFDPYATTPTSATPTATLTLSPTLTGIAQLNFSPDGSRLGASTANALVVWNLDDDGKIEVALNELGASVSPNFDRQGNFMAVAAGPSVYLFNLKEKRGEQELQLTGGVPVGSVNFDPKGETLFVAGSGALESFDVASGDQLQAIRRVPLGLTRFFPDGKLLATWRSFESPEIGVLDVETGKTIARLLHDIPVLWAQPSNTGKYVLGFTARNGMHVWRPSDGEEVFSISPPSTNKRRGFLCFSPDDTSFVYLDDQSVIVREIESNTVKRRFRLPFEPVGLSACQNAKGVLAVVGQDSIEVMNLDGRTVATLEGLKGLSEGVAVEISDDGRLVAAPADGEIVIWDLETGSADPVQRISVKRPPAFGVSFSPSGEKILLSYGDGVDVADVATGKVTSLSVPKGQRVTALFPQDERLIVTAAMVPGASQTGQQPDFTAGELVVWDAQTGKALQRFDASDPLFSASISRDGSRIATSTLGNSLTMWGLKKLGG